MRKFLSIILSCCMLAACSHEELIEPINDSNVPKLRDSNDIFNVQRVTYPEGDIWFDGPRGVDNFGNFYWTKYVDDGEYIMKYSHETNQVDKVISFEMVGENFCFDNKNNLCCVVFDNLRNQSFIRRIKSDGSSFIDQLLSGVPNEHINSDIIADEKGNIYMKCYPYIYKISSRGTATTIENREFIDDLVWYKASNDAFIGIYYYWDNSRWYKMSINSGIVQSGSFNFDIYHYGGGTGCLNQDYIYALDGYYVVRIDPNGGEDYDVAVIPSRYKNEINEFVPIGTPLQLYANQDATIFYIVDSGNWNIYKLTL